MFCKWNFTQSKANLTFHDSSSILMQRYQQLELVKLCKERGIHLQVVTNINFPLDNCLMNEICSIFLSSIICFRPIAALAKTQMDLCSLHPWSPRCLSATFNNFIKASKRSFRATCDQMAQQFWWMRGLSAQQVFQDTFFIQRILSFFLFIDIFTATSGIFFGSPVVDE